MYASVSGQIHKVCSSEKEAIAKVRELIDLICNQQIEYEDNEKPREIYVLPQESNKIYDMREFVKNYLDNGYLYELKERFAKSMFTGLGRIKGKTVGILASQPQFDAGVINYDASDKAAAFVRFCDAFDIPGFCILMLKPLQ
nr:carboxyl transferase domain-containing protein [uncultured Acetatifactor sp.]